MTAEQLAAALRGRREPAVGSAGLPAHDLQLALWHELLVVLAIFLAALAVRTWRLDAWPPGLFADEAAYGLDALSVLHGDRSIFFPRNTGREPLFPYLEAITISFLGATPYALRLTGAVIGALAVPAAYWMVRELFWSSPLGARRLALWSALFMAFGYWHISLNRIAFRANLLPLLAAVTFALFWRAWRTLLAGRRFPWLTSLLTGLALGATLYTYTAGRFMPILLALTVGATLLQRNRSRTVRLRVLGALALIAGASALVFTPLGWHFLQHPDQFAGRAAAISIFSPEFAADGPVPALARAAGQTALMFLTLGDPNLRHNPGARPAFDLLLGLWFYGGLALCLVRWRRLPFFFLAVWVLLLALPAILTAEATPHSLRATGMIPAVYVLPILAMLTAAAWLARRLDARLAPSPAAGPPGVWSRRLAWLPLPFLLFSAVTSLQGYFGAWSDLGRFNGVFMTNYAQLAADMARSDEPGVWLLPLSPNYFLTEATFSTMDFLTAGKTDYAGVLVDPDVIGSRLASLPSRGGLVKLLQPQDDEHFSEAGYILGDPKHLVKFVLDKYGILEGERDAGAVGMPFLVYRLPARAAYPVFGPETPLDVSFDGKVTLTAAGFGRTAGGAADAAVDSAQIPAGEPLWVTLRWRADAPIAVDLKTSLVLRAASGHSAGQVDDLLVGDRYPLHRVWEPGETTATYHILPALAGIAPGRYDLVLRVYEDQTQRPYPVADAAGTPIGIDAVLGSVEITPAQAPQVVAPQQPLPAGQQLAPNLILLGYDLPAATVAPGGTLPLTLYWHAPAPPPADYAVSLQLRPAASAGAAGSAAGETTGAAAGAAAAETRPIGGAYPTSRWAAGATIRDWQDLPVGPDAPNGSYTLWLTVLDGGAPAGELALGEVAVAGRPRTFTLPPLADPAEASAADAPARAAASLGAVFGQAVAFMGWETLPSAAAAPGSSLDLPLVWQVREPPTQSLVRFIHLIGPDGRPVAQVDSVPCAGECPATAWLAGEVLRDTVTLAIPPDAPPGRYTLAAGWYDAATLQRLAVRTAAGSPVPDNLLPLIPLTLAP